MERLKGSLKLFVSAMTLVLSTACNKSNDSFSLLSSGQTFEQSSAILNNKVDILWMVDGSGTMANHQTNLATNFNTFINDFTTKGFDFQMVVASTDAWVRESNYNAGGCIANPNPSLNPNTTYTSSADCATTLANYGQLTHFRDGDIYGSSTGVPGSRSGVYMITSLMSPATILSTFAANIKTGTRGDGVQESGLQSLRSVLRRNSDGSVGYIGETHTSLSSFRRSDAFFAVIIVSDEEDQSKKQNGTSYANTPEYVDSFKTFMDNYTGSVIGNRKYNVSSIVINDITNCSYGLHAQATQGDRYVAIANASEGVAASICSANFSTQLSDISKQILTLSTRFQLSREPIPSTIVVTVNGSTVAQDSSNGWIYISEGGFYYLEFKGTAIPPQGASISVLFDPITVIQ